MRRNGIKCFVHTHPIRAFFAATFLSAFLAVFTFSLVEDGKNILTDIPIILLGTLVGGAYLVLPCLITVVNLIGVFRGMAYTKTYHSFAAITLTAGVILTERYFVLSNIIQKDWWELIRENERHFPIWSEGKFSLFIVAALCILAYCILARRRAYEMPPLLIVFCMAMLYLWAIFCVVWCVQVSGGGQSDSPDVLLFLLPINCLLLILREIRVKILEWNSAAESHAQKEWTTPWNRLLQKAEWWPAWAFVAMLPTLGMVLCVLVLFGQAPDNLIRAFTETADWRLSEKIAPPSMPYDGHYLCTVAAGGDRNIVKPLRMGERHGHRVVVNRQLQVANAFEQVLEERTPVLHRRIRHFYDTYGYPISRHIRKEWACDLVYILMKPLEWCFLFVLYLADVHPEDRIAVQYLPVRPAE